MKKPFTPALLVVLSLAIAGLTGGCIYFNLMYNAENAFDTANKAHKKLLKDNPDSTIVLPPDVDNGYKKAIDKCNKVFEIYPKKKKWHGEALFVMGKAYYFDGDYDRAIHTFRQLQERFPANPFIAESYLYTGRAFLKKEDLDKAEETFAFVIEKYPGLNRNQEVTLLLAEIAIHREGKSQAIELLEKTYKTVRTPERKLELAIKIALLYKDVRLYDKAIAALESAPRPKDLPEQVYRAEILRVSCYAEKGDPLHAIDLLTVMLKSKPFVSHIPAMLLKKADILDRLNKTDEAMAVLKQIIDIYPSSDFVGNAWFDLARINQMKKNDLAKAKDCYDKAAGALKDPVLKDLAAQRSKAIDTIVKMRTGKAVKDTVKSDTVTPPDYKVGELFWLELDQPDSAFKYYCASARDTLHRSMIPKALYSAAWIARYALADSLRADSLYRLLIARFPANAFSRKAQEARGGPVTIMTRQDSARDAFHGAERLYWEDNNPDSAAEAYVKVYDAFGETDFGPKSLYAAAWIYDFVLDKNRSAKKLYELLCDSFPKSSYCLEAKPRLKTVSDTVAAMRAQKKLPQPNAAATAAKPAGAAKTSDSLHSVPKDTSHAGRKSADIITDRDTAVAKPPQAPAAATPPPGAPPAPGLPTGPDQSARYRRMRPGTWPQDSASSRAVPGAKPDSILKTSPSNGTETIGQ
jgi:TolA-binding protein